MAKILATGIATLDIINTVDGFPSEDSEVRATSQKLRRGGNATNTLTVLSKLGHKCFWAGTLADEPNSETIRAELNNNKVDYSYCDISPEGTVPTSYITLNQQNGSRTIVHYRDLEELSFSSFKQVNIETFDWLHFEGRNVNETKKMLQHTRERCVDQPVSLEIEKQRDDIESLIPYADVILFSKSYAHQTGYLDAEAFLTYQHSKNPEQILFCGWGDQGAYAIEPSGKRHHSPAFAPPMVIDTLGAGDTFNAGIIDALVSGKSTPTALSQACQLAGKKCGIEGFDI